MGVNRFLDTMAEVSDDDEDEDDGEDLPDDFMVAGGDDDDRDSRRAHAQLDNRREAIDERSNEEIAQALKGRYAGQAQVRYTGDMNEIPQRLLMPSVHDASLWQVRVKPGRERDIVYSLMRKALDMEYSANPLAILSAFQRDSLPGMVYVEARNSQQVNRACQGLVGVYPSRGIHLVPIDEMASLLMIKKIEQSLQPGSWVRIRRGKYGGDLAQVLDVDDAGDIVGLKVVPRIDLTPRDDDTDGRKRKKAQAPGTMRPPQRLFNYDEVSRVYGKKHVGVKAGVYVFQSDTYRDGFVEKEFKSSALIADDVQPTLDEITMFAGQKDGAEETSGVNLSVIAEASKKAAISVLQPGDHIEVFEGEQAGVHGVVDQINQDVVTFIASGSDLHGQKIEVPARSVRKRFKPGDHVKVMSGQNSNETGLVVAVSENVVTFVSDMTMQEISVFSKDLREAAEVGASTNIVGNYELHDLVQLDAQTVGVIFKTERDSFRVLDQNGGVRLVQPQQISMRRDSRRAIANDASGHEIRTGDDMKETDGESRRGHVVHIYQAMHVFLYNRDIAVNSGIFVTNARSLVSTAPRGMKPGDLSKMNPASAGGMVGSGMMRGPRDRAIGSLVTIVKGLNKGLIGTIKDTNGNTARVELHNAFNKMVSIDKSYLRRRLPNGQLEPLDGPSSRGGPPGRGGGRGGGGGFGGGRGWGGGSRTPNPYNNGGQTPGFSGGGRTPGWGGGGRTPNPYGGDGGRTPAWNAGSKTPNPYGESGKTPAWTAGSKTPNPYGSGRTPAWGGASQHQSNSTSGGGWGGATPGNAGSSSSSSWGGPSESASWGNTNDPGTSGWGSETSGAFYGSAPTPAAAATPALSAPTPGLGASVQTPYSAPTPWGAPTPAANASTPWAAATPASALGGGEGDSELDSLHEDWIFDIPNDVRSKIIVRVKPPREERYLDNKYDNAIGHVIAGMQHPNPASGQTITMKFPKVYGAENDTTGRAIHVRCIEPVHPERGKYESESFVVLLGPLELRHKVVIFREWEDDDNIMVSEVGSTAYKDLKPEWLCCTE
ncbi:transcription elongation factor SPT5 [Flagelloscypha sp. PMI_526]|nr:transcription elongation factor SPT5 [Flagelloscypha sp. PMI_526]